ncbi:MAG TPA: hypothetical protein VMY37_21020 [Thermoguttaceae bacterium]|nr:hypothetical protein [Thermoguttaceae bacterium]
MFTGDADPLSQVAEVGRIEDSEVKSRLPVNRVSRPCPEVDVRRQSHADLPRDTSLFSCGSFPEMLPGPKPQEVVIALCQSCDERLEVERGDAVVVVLLQGTEMIEPMEEHRFPSRGILKVAGVGRMDNQATG